MALDLIITSPPYDVEVAYDGYNDGIQYGKYLKFTEKWLRRCFDFARDDGRLCLREYIRIRVKKGKTATETKTQIRKEIIDRLLKRTMTSVNNVEIAKFLERMEKAIGETVNETLDKPNTFVQLLVEKTEIIVKDLDSRIRNEGVSYPTPNESNATARALLWVAWVSWLWTAKVHRSQPDTNAVKMRPIVEALMEQFISSSRLIGKCGRRPEEFIADVRADSA